MVLEKIGVKTFKEDSITIFIAKVVLCFWLTAPSLHLNFFRRNFVKVKNLNQIAIKHLNSSFVSKKVT